MWEVFKRFFLVISMFFLLVLLLFATFYHWILPAILHIAKASRSLCKRFWHASNASYYWLECGAAFYCFPAYPCMYKKSIRTSSTTDKLFKGTTSRWKCTKSDSIQLKDSWQGMASVWISTKIFLLHSSFSRHLFAFHYKFMLSVFEHHQCVSNGSVFCSPNIPKI